MSFSGITLSGIVVSLPSAAHALRDGISLATLDEHLLPSERTKLSRRDSADKDRQQTGESERLPDAATKLTSSKCNDYADRFRDTWLCHDSCLYQP